MAGGTEIKEEYTSSLADLTFNSKPLISVLTILAEENVAHAQEIVEAIEAHLARVRTEVKLPVLYLIDCIIKNVGGNYTALFCQNIVSTFCSVFEKVDEKTRSEMFRLRQTWGEVIPPKKLYALDVQIKQLDPAWPLTVPPSPIGIHLNPKFFMPTTTSADSNLASTSVLTNTQSSSSKSSNSKTDVDPKTLSMQQKIINKQRELLELQQKKVQLELLQTQVKLQEQLKSSQVPTSTTSAAQPRNLLLKPEVAKQLVPDPTIKTGPSKSRSGTHGRNTPRIAPVQSSLINARPVRDPRLLRQLQQQPQEQNIKVPSSIHVDSKSKSETQVTESSNNTIVNNKTNVRNDRVQHRLVDNNKGNTESHGKFKNLPFSFPPKHTQKIGNSNHTKGKTRDNKTSPSPELKAVKISNPVDSPFKSNRNVTVDKNEVFSKLKFRKKNSVRSEKDSTVDKNSIVLFSPERVSDKKSDKYSKSSDKHIKDNSKSVFREFKGSTKNRAHIKRNRVTTPSPEVGRDIDLRTEAQLDKSPRLQNSTGSETNESSEIQKPIDIDLRHSQSTPGKKRSSSDTVGSPAKKSKSEMFDVLFGSEDTDLRQLPVGDTKPPTPPPPPIISTKDVEIPVYIPTKENKKEEVKEVLPVKNPNLDALRAKLANAINQDKLKESEELKSSIQNKSPSIKRGSNESLNNTQIIISPADEMGIKAGNMTNEQKTTLMSKILAQMETQQLREAQRRESENLNSTFQPISDDEFDMGLSDDASDEDSQKRKSNFNKDNWTTTKVDKPPELPTFGNVQDDFSTYQHNMDYRDSRRGRTWRNGRHRQKHWDSGPPARVGTRQPFRPLLDPWIRPLRPPPQMNMNTFIPAPPIDIPPLVFAHPDTYKFITIDSEPREIRYYDETAIVFLSSGDPREITFHNGTRRIFFDNEPCILHFNSPYEDVLIKGNRHKVRLGGPAREIFIDGNGYECYFDQKEKLIELDGNCIVVKLEPPPPQVKIGEKRLDLVAGKIQLVVDAKNMFTVFLDAKLQTFKIDDVEHTLKFVDELRAALIDDVRHEVEFGGLPKSIMLKDKKYFIRFSVLPKNIKPGVVTIKDMEVTQVYRSPVHTVEEVAPNISTKTQTFKPDSPEGTNSQGQFEMHRQDCDNLDILSSVMASSMITAEGGGSYSIEHTLPSESLQEVTHQSVKPQPKVEPNSSSSVFNINDLFQRLVATGIVATASAPLDEPEFKIFPNLTQDVDSQDSMQQNFRPQDDKSQNIKLLDFKPEEYIPQDFKPQEFKPLDIKPQELRFPGFKPPSFSQPDTLKLRRPDIIDKLYAGQQCSTCGARFLASLNNYYKQHLDWHFRQNRKNRRSNRLSASRRWHYSFSDWKNFEEIENLEERGKSYFENQASNANNEVEDEDIEIPCVSADPDVTDPICEVCLEKLEQFYNEENEEWQLRMAIRVEDKIYHPLCYDDYQASLMEVSLNTDIHEIPGLDGVAEAPSPEPNDIDDVMEVIDNIDDEVEPEPPAPSATPTADEHAYKILEENNLIDDDSDEADDDVILNEVAPERIVVDDDKDDDYEPPSVSEPATIPAIIIKEEPMDDGFVDIECGLGKQATEVKIKTEPVDKIVDGGKPDKTNAPTTSDTSDTTHIEVVSSIDGNFELESLNMEQSSASASNAASGKIKINITKPIPTVITKEIPESINETLNPTYVDPSEPLPPGEEPVQLNIKPALQGVELKRNPVVRKGSELTGLCSIM